MLSERILELLRKRREGTCSSLELQELDDWYASFDHLESETEKALFNDLAEEELIKFSIRTGIDAQLAQSSADPEGEMLVVRPLHPVRKWWKQFLAACVVILLIGGITFYKNPFLSGAITVSTKADEITRLVLPDSSVVWLKAGSRIRYNRKMRTGPARELFLEGEGFFDIAHHPSRPFIVHTSFLHIKVLGTIFNVRSNSQDQEVETTLFKGSVRIDQKDNTTGPVTLLPNQRAVYSKGSGLLKVSNLSSEKAIDKKEIPKPGVSMVFDEKPFEDLLAHMEQKFGVRIYIHNRSLLRCSVTADLEKESLTEILNLLKISYGISYSIYGRELFIEGTICK
ncbi:hypothetical protein DYBT9275_02237 [Dyadobacter sp. CECT 9275]|uniref:FecR family protein n=1 Tax=Dyadobacter helix TaxID=2822344 RepID=A0A916N5R0_9BACT|nr:FecR family protein [Dyadobacter sp. CECT 9275]CAG4999476.1 hypothetical protein DYBT9275_02237 [Dyadobacter sp. CECT 9275]